MEQYKKDFIELLLAKQGLKFGEFTLKSGRKSPYFISTRVIADGDTVGRLGKFYAAAIKETMGDGFDLLFGPSYAGVPLAVTTSIALNSDFGINKGFCFDRKEMKLHGDASDTDREAMLSKVMLGQKVKDNDRVIIMDDVMTTGATKHEALKLLNELASGLKFPGLAIAFDRQELGNDGRSAVDGFTADTGIPVYSIVTIRETLDYLSSENKITAEQSASIAAYLKQYGSDSAKVGL